MNLQNAGMHLGGSPADGTLNQQASGPGSHHPSSYNAHHPSSYNVGKQGSGGQPHGALMNTMSTRAGGKSGAAGFSQLGSYQ